MMSESRARAVVATVFAVVLFVLLGWQTYVFNHTKAQLAAASTRARLWDHLIQRTETSIIVVTEDGGIFDWNPAATQLFGYKREEAVGRSLDFLMPEAQNTSHYNYLRDPRVKKRLQEEVLTRACQMYNANRQPVDVKIQVRGVASDPYLFVIMVDRASAVNEMQTGEKITMQGLHGNHEQP